MEDVLPDVGFKYKTRNFHSRTVPYTLGPYCYDNTFW